jgi:2-polyprenyl-6-methoxyphenol hydroxylase-like FAD-dependent oxidoreductase
MVLQILYKNIKDKSKILPSKHVIKVQLEQRGVKATTEDGHTYIGDILIGTDGIHSTIREEIWRLSEKTSPGYVPASESTSELFSRQTVVFQISNLQATAIPYIYSCIFGILNPCQGIELGSYHSVFR